MRKKFTRGNLEEEGKMVWEPGTIHVSNVQLVCPDTGLPTKAIKRYLEDGTKVRVSMRTGAVIPRPDILKTRRKPKGQLLGPRDTLPEDAHEVTFFGLDPETGYEIGYPTPQTGDRQLLQPKEGQADVAR
ncbi:unnamed protein product [Chrysoparadoxa australica]